MKTALVFLVTLVTIVYGQDIFRFPTDKKKDACVLATFNASFELTLTKGNETQPVTIVLPVATDVKVDGSCASSNSTISTLDLTFDKDDFNLVFTLTKKNEKVSAQLQFVIAHPNSTFKNLNYSESVSLTSSDGFSDISNSNQSYLCKAQEKITLMSNQPEFNISANLLFIDLQIQGFGVKDSNFSDPNECSADKTTTASTTTASTTTAMTTTMSPPPPIGVGNYTLTKDNVTCLRLEANISISVSYPDKEGKTMSHTVMVPGDAGVSGDCGDKEIKLNLAVKEKAENETSGNLRFVFTKMEGYSIISKIDFALNFSDANETVTGSNDDTNNVLALSDKYFVCNGEKFMLGKEDSVELQDLKVQAFDLADGDFSSSGLNCSSEPPKSPTSGNYTVKDGNVTCISMAAAITLKVNYLNNKNKNQTKNVNFEMDQPTYGQCSAENDTAEFIIVQYKESDFMVEFQFAKESKVSSSLGADTFTFYVKNITVKYTLDQYIFDDAEKPGESHTFSLSNQKLLQTSSDKYYMCSAESTFEINPSVSLVTKDLRLVAFNTDTKEPNLFGSNAEECEADTETNSVVPIAVGAALAGLVVIVLIAYLIGRRRNNKGYESV